VGQQQQQLSWKKQLKDMVNKMFLSNLHINHAVFPTLEKYPFSLEVFQKTTDIKFTKSVTFFSGENGSGKTTLLKAIARAWKIHLWCESEYTPVERNPYAELLYTCLTFENGEEVPGAFFAAQNFKRYAELVDEWAKVSPEYLIHHGGEPLTSKSHGQTNMQYFRNRFKIKGLYLLDEPEAALSPKSQLELLEVISESRANGNTQFIIATHSPILLGLKDAEILNFDTSPISSISYTETDYYKVYKEVLNNYNN
jgi:predicted ATPase